jgi:hypothetical protein
MGIQPLKIESVAVVGAGVMGAGIAQTAAYADYKVILKDIKDEFLQRGIGTVRRLFENLVKADKWEPADVERKMALVSGVVKDADFAKTAPSLIIEAAVEDMDVKKLLFAQWGMPLGEAKAKFFDEMNARMRGRWGSRWEDMVPAPPRSWPRTPRRSR